MAKIPRKITLTGPTGVALAVYTIERARADVAAYVLREQARKARS